MKLFIKSGFEKTKYVLALLFFLCAEAHADFAINKVFCDFKKNKLIIRITEYETIKKGKYVQAVTHTSLGKKTFVGVMNSEATFVDLSKNKHFNRIKNQFPNLLDSVDKIDIIQFTNKNDFTATPSGEYSLILFHFKYQLNYAALEINEKLIQFGSLKNCTN